MDGRVLGGGVAGRIEANRAADDGGDKSFDYGDGEGNFDGSFDGGCFGSGGARWRRAQDGGGRSAVAAERGFDVALASPVSVRAAHGGEGWRFATPASSTPSCPPSILASLATPTASSEAPFIGEGKAV